MVSPKDKCMNRRGILFITRKWPPAIGGIETYSVALSQALRDHAKVEVFALPGRECGSPPSMTALLVFGFRAIVHLLSKKDPCGVVHVADMASWPLAVAARLRSRRWRIALSAHGTDVSYSLRGGVKGRLYGWYLRTGSVFLRQAVVIANSSATANCAREHGFARTIVVPLATDLQTPGPLGEPERFVLFVGRLVERKGCAWFIRNVLARLPAGITLKVVGTVWSEAERAMLSDPRVDFVGPKPQDEIVGLYAKALCVVVPNIDVPNGEFEGFGLVATEASACGGISLASKHSGLCEAVIDGVTGFHLPPEDVDAWTAKISEISSWSAETRRCFIERSLKETQRLYSWDRVADETARAYVSGSFSGRRPKASMA